MLSSTNNIFPPLVSFRSHLYTVEYLSLLVGKIASQFVSLIMSVSILPPMSDESTYSLEIYIKISYNYFVKYFT